MFILISVLIMGMEVQDRCTRIAAGTAFVEKAATIHGTSYAGGEGMATYVADDIPGNA
jgi:hypothetical protein